MWAKQSTAATLIVGPVLDSTGAEYTSAVIGDLSISKNGGTLTALASAATLTHIANGQYTLVMTTGNLDTLGRAQITCNKSTYQMPTVGLLVVPAMVFDSLVLGTDVLQGDAVQFAGSAITAAAGVTIPSSIASQTSVDTIDDLLDTEMPALTAAIATVQSDTNDIQATLAAGVELDSADKDVLVDLIWDEVLTGATHNVATSSGKRLRQTTAFQQIDSTVIDAAATSTTFVTGLTSSVDDFYNDSMLVFTDGALAGQVRAIYDYIGATKTIILEEALTSAPVNGVAFAIVSLHIHPVSQIQSGLATSAALATESAKITAIETFATRMTTGLVVDGAVYQFTANMLELGPSGGGGGDATLAKQTEILAAIQGSAVIQVASPNVSGNLVLTQGDDYDGVANPKASWTVTTDYTSGWTVRLTIRSATDAVVYTNTGSVVSATVVAVTIAAPTGLTMTGCPGQWQGKFDVELTHSSGKKKTIALGVCYINEDQTR